MPNIPTYRSRITADSASFPKIPSAYGQEGIATLNEASTQARDVGATLDYKLKQLKQVEDMAKFGADADRALLDLHTEITTSPDFYQDPEGARGRFQAKANEIKQKFLPQITDNEVRVKWQSQFDNDSLRRESDIVNEGRKQRVASGIGTGERTLATYSAMAAQAKTDEEFEKYLGRGIGTIRALTASGAYREDVGVKRELAYISESISNRAQMDILRDPEGAYDRIATKVGIYQHLTPEDHRQLLTLAKSKAEHEFNKSQAETKRAKEEGEQVELKQSLTELQSLFPGDYERQLAHAQDAVQYKPAMDLPKRQSLVAAINSTWDTARRIDDDQRKSNTEKVFDYYVSKGIDNSDITAMDSGKLNVDPNIKQRMLDLNAKKYEDKFKTDPAVYFETQRKIWNREITSIDQAPIGDGIGMDKVGDVKASIKEASDPVNSEYMNRSEKLFAAKYKDTKYEWMLQDFMNLMDLEIKKAAYEGKPLAGRDIYDLANKFMQEEDEKTWFGMVNRKPKFVDRLEDRWVPQDKLDKAIELGTGEAMEVSSGKRVVKPVPVPRPDVQQRIDSLYDKGYTTQQIKDLMSTSKKPFDVTPYKFRNE